MSRPTRRQALALFAGAAALAELAPLPARAWTGELVARMTLAEKIGQLTMLSADLVLTGPSVTRDVAGDLRAGRVGSLFNLWGRDAVRAAQRTALEETRLGIPLFFGLDVVHGFRTIFPIPVAEAGAFDPALWEATAAAASAEAAAAGVDLTFAPMLDVTRDPRWGRIAEGPGEDPYVAARFAEAKVRGIQGSGGLAATAKHFVAYGASAAGRDYAAVDISERALAEIYLPPFRAAVEAGAAAIMPAFTDIAGAPLTANRALLTGTLREAWGFTGAIISDYGAIGELKRHGIAADDAEAAALALNAGVDIDMMSLVYRNGLPAALDRGLVTLAKLDAAVTRVLDLKSRLGLFDDPYRRCHGPDALAPPPSPALRAAARDAATRSITLLADPAGLLPLATPPDRLALIGPLADAAGEMLGPWAGAGRAEEAVSVLAGLRAAWPGTVIEHVAGTPIAGDTRAGISAARAAAERADLVILSLGESATMSGEAASRARLDLPGAQSALARDILAAGKPTIVLLFSGRPITMPEVFASRAAILACWFPGSETGPAIASLLTGATAPSACLAVTWPREVGQVPIGYSNRPSGRPENPADKYTSKYLDTLNSPQFPFGHGLTYTRFTLTDPTVGAQTISLPGPIRIETEVANTGPRPGTATVFLFLRDPVASISRPTLELRRFRKITLAPGETRTLRFELEASDLAFTGPDLAPIIEPGEFEIHIGFSADPATLRATRFRLR